MIVTEVTHIVIIIFGGGGMRIVCFLSQLPESAVMAWKQPQSVLRWTVTVTSLPDRIMAQNQKNERVSSSSWVSPIQYRKAQEQLPFQVSMLPSASIKKEFRPSEKDWKHFSTISLPIFHSYHSRDLRNNMWLPASSGLFPSSGVLHASMSLHVESQLLWSCFCSEFSEVPCSVR